MTTGPLQRVIAVTGLACLVPVVAMLLVGSITPEVAALRALAVIGAVVVLDQVARSVLTGLLGRIEVAPTTSQTPEPPRAPDSSGRAAGPSTREPVTEVRDTVA